jgi:hypothetical protein
MAVPDAPATLAALKASKMKLSKDAFDLITALLAERATTRIELDMAYAAKEDLQTRVEAAHVTLATVHGVSSAPVTPPVPVPPITPTVAFDIMGERQGCIYDVQTFSATMAPAVYNKMTKDDLFRWLPVQIVTKLSARPLPVISGTV